MVLRSPLTVRVSDGQTDRLVTRYCRGLKFTKVAPGGHQSLAVSVNLPRNTFSDLGPADKIWVYDGRNGNTIFGQAYLENPTPVDGPNGQAYNLSAAGGMAVASDQTRGLVYVTTDLGEWENDPVGYSSSQFDTVGTGLRLQFGGGDVVATNAFAAIKNTLLDRINMNLGAVRVEVYGGKLDANYVTILATDAPYSAYIGDTTPRLNTSHNTSTKWVGTDFGTSQVASLYFQRINSPTTVGDDTTWAQFDGCTMLGQRMDRNGTLLTGAAGLVSATQVLASQVVEDLLGRLLTSCDPASAQVDATSFAITQLAYPEGIKAAGVLNDLAVYEPDYLWEILETLANGKHRFNYRAWPTAPRYVVSVEDGWVQKGSDTDLCNRILVSYTDATGKVIPVEVTAAGLGLIGLGLPVDALGSRIKDADPVTLPAGVGSAANATQIGGQILTEKINPPLAGTVLVRRPIQDALTGAQVMPWELEPGYVCRIRETGDELRITQADYDDDTTSMLLTLGIPQLTTDQRAARLGTGREKTGWIRTRGGDRT